MDYQIVTKPSFKVVGFELRTSGCDGRNLQEIPAFWQEYLAKKLYNSIPNKLHKNNPVELGICTDFQRDTGEFSYIIGTEVDNFSPNSEMVCREFPEATYAVFTTPKASPEHFTDSIQQTWKRIFEEWFPHSGYEHAGGAELELYDERCHADKHELLQMDIYVPIQKR